jgi:hypothetical protein
LDAPNSAHQKYVEALRTWTERREALIGTSEKRGDKIKENLHGMIADPTIRAVDDRTLHIDFERTALIHVCFLVGFCSAE